MDLDTNIFNMKKYLAIMDSADSTPHYLNELAIQTAELKALNLAKTISVENLLITLNRMENLIRNALEENENNPRTAIDAILICLHLMTSKDMPQRIYFESLMEAIVLYVTSLIEDLISIKARCKKGSWREKDSMSYYLKKTVEIIVLLQELLYLTALNDDLLSIFYQFCLSTFFVDNQELKLLQSACLGLITNIFLYYENEQGNILNEILLSTANNGTYVPVYQLSEHNAIQMVTILLLQLIQSLAVFEEKSNIDEKSITKKYSIVLSMLTNFLKSFLMKAIHPKSSDVYFDMFKNFLKDLLKAREHPEWSVAKTMLFCILKDLSNTIKMSEDDLSTLRCFDLLNSILPFLKNSASDADKKTLNNRIPKKKTKNQTTWILHSHLVDFLTENSYGFHFYVVQYFVDGFKPQTSTAKETKKRKIDGCEEKTILIKKLGNWIEGGSVSKVVDRQLSLIIYRVLNEDEYVEYFEQFLELLLHSSQNVSISIRKKSLKCLETLVVADWSLLERDVIVKLLTHIMIADSSVTVRDLVVRILAQFIKEKPDCITCYYRPLLSRVSDSAISIRKCVIAIFGTLCLQHPTFENIPEILIEIVNGAHGEPSVMKQTVFDVFQNLWFHPCLYGEVPKTIESMLRMIQYNEGGFSAFKTLINKLLSEIENHGNNETNSTNKQKDTNNLACQQIIDCLVEKLPLNDGFAGDDLLFVKILRVFARNRPKLFEKHLETFEKYLDPSIKYSEVTILSAIKIISTVLPSICPTLTLSLRLEKSVSELILENINMYETTRCCVSFLSLIVKQFTRNIKNIKRLFKKTYFLILQTKENFNLRHLEANVQEMESLSQAILVFGLLFEHFNIITEMFSSRTILDLVMFFLREPLEVVQTNALHALGSLSLKSEELMLEPELKTLYTNGLVSSDFPVFIKRGILANIEMYLFRDEQREMLETTMQYESNASSLRQTDTKSLITPILVIDQYIDVILKSYFHPNIEIRLLVFRIIQRAHHQGLDSPNTIVPCLICSITDRGLAQETVVKANKLLREIEMRYAGCIQSQYMKGVKLSYELQRILQNTNVVRGYEERPGKPTASLLNELYLILTHSKKQRNLLVFGILNYFHETKNSSLSFLLYLADNLAHFSYKVEEEVLFLIRKIDSFVLIEGPEILHLFQQELVLNYADDFENENLDQSALLSCLPENISNLQKILEYSQVCSLLFLVRQHLKEMYNISKREIANQEYLGEKKNIGIKSMISFNPMAIIDNLNHSYPIEDERERLIVQFLNFKKTMLQLDREEKISYTFKTRKIAKRQGKK